LDVTVQLPVRSPFAAAAGELDVVAGLGELAVSGLGVERRPEK
jgi:hypothetical protein